MLDLVIHTYGHIDAMFYILNGIAMLMNSTFTTQLIQVTSIVATAYYCLQIAYAGNQPAKIYLMRIVGMVVVINALLVPKVDMMIIDHVTKKREKVDNLPVGFAVPIGILELFGDVLTEGFEQAFSTTTPTNYRDYGMVFGARLVQDSRNWRIKTPENTQNMLTFLRRCVVRDAMIGYKYTPNDLLTTDNIWGLISANLNTLRRVGMRSGKSFELVTCKEAAMNYILPAFKEEAIDLKRKKQSTDFGLANSGTALRARDAALVNSYLEHNISNVFSTTFGNQSSATELIKQQMMINSLSDVKDEYAFARSSMQQESSWRISGDLAATYLPILLTVIKGLIYSSFIFMIPFMLVSGGGARYLSYLTVVASLQLWPALNSVLNLFIELYSGESLASISSGVISYATFSAVGAEADKIVAVASGLQISIPFLAFAIVQGGAGSFIHLASNITGASQSAAASAASEVTSGNRSLDNISYGNMQLAMQSGFKTDLNQSYADGAQSFQHMDGTMEKVMGSGQTIMQSGTGINLSGGGVKYNLESSVQDQVSQGLQGSESLLASDQRSYSDAKSKTLSKTADYVSHLAQREHSGESFNYDKMGEQGNALQQAVNHTRQLHDRHGYGWNQAAQSSLEAAMNISPPGLISKVTGFTPSIGGKGSISAANTSDQSVGQDTTINRDTHSNNSYNNIVKAASNESWAKEQSLDRSYSEAVRGSCEQQQRLESQVSQRQEEVNSWHHAKNHLNSSGASYSRDMYDHVESSVMQQYGVSAKDAHSMIESHDPRVERVWNNIVAREVIGLKHEIDAGKNLVTGPIASKDLDNFDAAHNHKITSRPDEQIREKAEENNFNAAQIKHSIQTSQQSLNADYEFITADNYDRNNKVHQHNTNAEDNLLSQVNKHEEDRIGQGSLSRKVMEKANSITRGLTGDSIGAPLKDQTDTTHAPANISKRHEVDAIEHRQVSSNNLNRLQNEETMNLKDTRGSNAIKKGSILQESAINAPFKKK